MELSTNRTHGLTNGDQTKLNEIRNRDSSNRNSLQKEMKEIN
jgi:hypothetical protein